MEEESKKDAEGEKINEIKEIKEDAEEKNVEVQKQEETNFKKEKILVEPENFESDFEEIQPADDEESNEKVEVLTDEAKNISKDKLEEKTSGDNNENLPQRNIFSRLLQLMPSVFHLKKKDDDVIEDPEAGKELLTKTRPVRTDRIKPESGSIEIEEKSQEKKENWLENDKDVPDQKSESISHFHRVLRIARERTILTVAILATLLMFIVIFSILISSISTNKSANRRIQAETHCGSVEGQIVDDILVFLGIPYALPPVGARRWKPPKVVSTLQECWEGVYQAKQRKSLCFQKPLPHPFESIEFSEDCLYLDIYTPELSNDDQKPVVVYFAGDSFQGHDTTDIMWRPTPSLVRERNVVFVVVSYRMNAFGFLALELLTKDMYPPTSGNYGIHDMITAVTWVNENIDSFGGNPSKVTLLGHGSGATGILALMTTKQTRLMFNKAWVTGGSAYFVNKTLRDVERDNEVFNRHLVCETAACLYSKSAAEIMSIVPTSEWPFWGAPTHFDLPTSDEHVAAIAVVDGKILYDVPSVMWGQGDYNDVTFVVGSSMHSVGAHPLVEDFVNWNWTEYMSHVKNRLGTFGSSFALEAINKYSNLNSTPQEQYIQMVSDVRVTCPLLQLAHRASKSFSNMVYSYVVNYIPDRIVKHVTHDFKMSVHGLDIIAIFGRIHEHVHNPSQGDLKFQSSVQDLFFNFVHNERFPSSPSVSNPKMPWYVNIVNGTHVTPESTPYKNCEFWSENGMYPRFGRMN